MANKATEMATGLKVSDLIGKYCPKVIHGLDGPYPGCPLEEAVKKGHGVECDFQDTSSGLWLNSMAHPTDMKTKDGKRIFIHMTRDISAQKIDQLEKKEKNDTQSALNTLLRLSLEDITIDEILRKALDLILSIPWLSLESKGSVFIVEDEPEVLVMKAEQGLSEHTRFECGKLPFGRCICGKAAQSQQIQFVDSIDDSHRVTHKGVSPHGHYCVPIVYRGQTLGVINTYLKEGHVRDENEEDFLLAMASAIAGVINQRYKEEKLINSEERLQIIFESAPDAYYINDLKGTFIDGNKATEKVTGYKREELIGKNFLKLQLLSKKQIPKASKSLAKNVQGKPSGPDEFVLKRKDGTMVNLEIKTYPVQIEGKKLVLGMARDLTERKQAEERANWLASFPQLNTNPIIEVTPKGDITYINPAAQEKFPDLEKQGVIHPVIAGVPDLLGKLEKMKGESLAREVSVDDTIYEEQLAYVKERDVVRIYTVDVTERRKAEEGLRASEEKFRAVFERASDGIVAADLETKKFVLANKSMCELTGYSEKELLGLSIEDIHPKEEIPRAIDMFAQLARGEITLANEIPVLRKDGKVIYCDISSEVIEINRRKDLIGFFRDVTERRKTEEELRVSEQRLRLIFESNPDAVFLYDLKGMFIDCNKVAEELTGFKRDEIKGMHFSKISRIPVKDIPRAMKILARSALGKPTGPDLFTFENKDKTKVVMEVKGFPIELEGRKLILSVGRDVTEQKKKEAERQDLVLELGDRVKELNCLYTVSELVEDPDIDMKKALEQVAGVLPPGWQYPDITCARIKVEDKEFRSSGFMETEWKQSANIDVNGKSVGLVEVYYKEEMPRLFEGPFLQEERDLINTVAEMIGSAIEHIQASENLKTTLHQVEQEKDKAEQRTVELERLNKVMVGRELKMIELKKEMDKLKKKTTSRI